MLTVPFEHQLSTLESVRAGLQGKILIDVTVPLIPPKVGTVQLPPEGSAGKRAQNFLGDGVKVVTAFQNVAAHLLQQDVKIECDVLVAGNSKEARDKVVELVEEAGMSGLARRSDRELRRRRSVDVDSDPDQSPPLDLAFGHQDRRPKRPLNNVLSLTFTPIAGMPMVRAGDDLAALILAALTAQHLTLAAGDILVVAQKIVSKSEGRQLPLATITPSEAAIATGQGNRQRSPSRRTDPARIEPRCCARSPAC